MKYKAKDIIRHLSQDFSYKSVALAVALVLWVTMISRKDITVTQKLPLQVLSEANFEVSDQSHREVDVEVAGPRMALKRFSEMKQAYELDLSNFKDGTHRVRLTREGFVLPVGAKLINIKPDEIVVTIVSAPP